MQPIPITISKALEEILIKNNIKPEDYGPAYGGESAGIDLYYTGSNGFIIENNKGYEKTSGKKDKVLLPTGLHIALPPTMVGLVMERGSISKTTLVRRAGVIDAGYTGEIFVNLVDIGSPCLGVTSMTHIEPGAKLPVQLIVLPVCNQYKLLSREEYDSLVANSKRKEGQVGSSDVKVEEVK